MDKRLVTRHVKLMFLWLLDGSISDYVSRKKTEKLFECIGKCVIQSRGLVSQKWNISGFKGLNT